MTDSTRIALALHKEIENSGIEIVSVHIPDEKDKSSWKVSFANGVTDSQKILAQEVINRLDINNTHLDRIESRRKIAKLSALAISLSGKTPEESEKWVDDNVTDLESAKTALKVITRLLMCILRNSDILD